MVVDQMHFPLDPRKVRNVHFTNAIQHCNADSNPQNKATKTKK